MKIKGEDSGEYGSNLRTEFEQVQTENTQRRIAVQDRYSPLILKLILKVSKFHPQTSPLSLNPILRYPHP